jgi:hypothetical protein
LDTASLLRVVAHSCVGAEHFSPWKSPYTYKADKTTAIAALIENSIGYSYLGG